MFVYLIALLIGIVGLTVIDWRYKLAYWRDAKRTALTVFVSMAVFIVWDFMGIFLGIFFHGESTYSLPFVIAPDFPLEELFFLYLLSYCALILYQGATAWLSRTSS